MNKIDIKIVVENLIDTFLQAGKISLDLRRKGLTKKIKSDNTPVSNGDLEVNEILTNKINQLTPNIRIISEETSDNKEEFTINAGLIIKRKPVAGLINAPAKNRMFYSYGGGFSFEIKDGKSIKLECSKNRNNKEIKFVSYSNNIKSEIADIHNKLNVKDFVRMKSSLKFCVIAAGEFDGYVAEPRACEWDIAAGHAILDHAGGIVTDFNNQKIKYGKKDFKNPSLIIKRNSILNG